MKMKMENCQWRPALASSSRWRLCLLPLLTSLILTSCHDGGKAPSALAADTLRYATNLTCQRGNGYSVWTLRDPWDTTQVLHRYILMSRASQDSVPADDAIGSASVIHVPVQRAGVATAVHCGLIDELGCAASIAGVCEQQYIDLQAVTDGLASGRIADFGNGMNPNIERIMDVQPDVLLLTPFEHSGGYGRVERLGIPIVECAEYMEASPLARAEWIRFYGELFGADAVADSIFASVEASYNELKALAATSASRPRVLTEMMYAGQWFVPCGGSTMGIMFADAGADYAFATREGRGSTALPFEMVLDEAGDADVWFVKYNSAQPLTYSGMAEDYKPYTRFRPWQQHTIWSCDLAHNHFYEQTPFHPDRLLHDFIAILHPELMPNYQTRYYQPMIIK